MKVVARIVPCPDDGAIGALLRISPNAERMRRLHRIPENVRDHIEGPVLIHIFTQKRKGCAPTEAAFDKLHGANPLAP